MNREPPLFVSGRVFGPETVELFVQEPAVIERNDLLRYFEFIGVILKLVIRVLGLRLSVLHDVSGSYTLDVVGVNSLDIVSARRPLNMVQILVQQVYIVDQLGALWELVLVKHVLLVLSRLVMLGLLWKVVRLVTLRLVVECARGYQLLIRIVKGLVVALKRITLVHEVLIVLDGHRVLVERVHIRSIVKFLKLKCL